MSSTKDGSKIPVKFDVTASAKVGWEVKGEIPSSSLGRLVDSFTDMIRPFSESRGLKADLLRLQREDVLYDITRRAVERLQLEGREVKPIPVKTLVPLLEKASLEDPESDMIDWWVGLLAETSQDQGLQHPVYSDLLSKITSAEASYLQKMLAVSLPSVLDADEVNIEEIFRREVDTKLSPLVRLE